MTERMERIGVAGLGKMGAALARAWAGHGLPLTGWTRRGLDPAEAEAMGVAVAADPAALAAASDILVTSLTDDAAVEAVLGALAQTDLTGKLIVETSTISPETTRRLAVPLRAAGAEIIDAPISGGPEMIAAGTAGFFLGGPVDAVARFQPIAAPIANRWHHSGTLGQGLSMKIVNNMVLSGYVRALHDAVAVGARAGLGLPEMLAVLLESPAASGFLKARAAAVLGEDDRVGFAAEQAVGDMEVFLAEAARLGVEAPGVAGMKALAETAVAGGYGAEDVASLVHRAATGAE